MTAFTRRRARRAARRHSGENIGVASDVVQPLPEFVTEPDNRNLNTPRPDRRLCCCRRPAGAPAPLARGLRRKISPCARKHPQSCDSHRFERSNPVNPYHDLIEATYGPGCDRQHSYQPGHHRYGLVVRLRLVRCEAALLALSASSPFLDGASTGHHSHRWYQFPRTPNDVPLFVDHAHFIGWIEQQLACGSMRNERHLWTSVRPNGSRRPYALNRLELRICDLVTDPHELLAITTLLELRLLALKTNPTELDPLHGSTLTPAELADLAEANDAAASRASLNADLRHWRNGELINCRTWIRTLIDELTPLAEATHLKAQLQPLETLLQRGNQAMRWQAAHDNGTAISELLAQSIQAMVDQELISPVAHGTLG